MLDLEMVTWQKLGQSYMNNISGENLSSKEVRHPNSNFNTSHTTENENLLKEK